MRGIRSFDAHRLAYVTAPGRSRNLHFTVSENYFHSSYACIGTYTRVTSTYLSENHQTSTSLADWFHISHDIYFYIPTPSTLVFQINTRSQRESFIIE